jgi:ATP-dependent DNA helicase RecG
LCTTRIIDQAAVSPRYCNRRIGEFLKELVFTEGRSTGIPKILKVMLANGSPAPEFESNDSRTHFLIRLPVHARAMARTEERTQSDQIIAALLEGSLCSSGQ